MHRIDVDSAVAALPSPGAAGPNPDSFFTEGDEIGGQPATVVDYAWANAVQEEICNVIEMNGGTLSKTDRTQLYTSIVAMIAASAHAVIIDAATFEGTVADGNAVYWDSANTRFAKAIADGSAAQNAVGIADVTNSRVVSFGETPAGIVSGLTPGAKYYLDGSTAGALTTTAPSNIVVIGIAKSATLLFVDIDMQAATATVPAWNVQVYSADDTFVVPAGVTQLMVDVWGGGGGGGGTDATSNGAGGGGGGGGRAWKLCTVTPAQNVTVTVGTGGAGGVAGGTGGTGGTTSFGAFCSATGGTGGGSDNAQNGSGGAGGAGSGGDINMTGSAGSASLSTSGLGGAGGNAPAGGGGGRGALPPGNGGVGGSPGGGGGGATSTGAAQTGGAGADGEVRIVWRA